MSIIKWTPYNDPFAEFEKMLAEWPGYTGGRSFVPAVDIYQDEINVYAEIPLPGINIKDVSISVDNDILTVEGSREHKSEIEEKEYYRKEIRKGSFHRSVALPAAVNSAKAEAEYKDGVLKVTVEKQEKTQPKKIEIKIK